MTGDDVRNAKLREKLRGYHPADVDEALGRGAAMLDTGACVAADVRATSFRRKLRGYHPADVDALLDQLVRDSG